MRAVIQRVSASDVKVDGAIVGAIGKGLNVLVAFGASDQSSDIDYIAEKIAGLRIFEDENGKMNRSVKDVGGAVLIISQFTLYGDVRKGKRPSFTSAISCDDGQDLYDSFVENMQRRGIPVQTGIYGADMKVNIQNDGPVTILIDSKKQF